MSGRTLIALAIIAFMVISAALALFLAVRGQRLRGRNTVIELRRKK